MIQKSLRIKFPQFYMLNKWYSVHNVSDLKKQLPTLQTSCCREYKEGRADNVFLYILVSVQLNEVTLDMKDNLCQTQVTIKYKYNILLD